MPRIDYENPLLEKNANHSLNGEICSKGNLVLLNLNLSRILKKYFEISKKNLLLFFFLLKEII
jgi:hypothetical protein